MNNSEFWDFVEKNSIIGIVDSDHSCMNFKITEGVDGISVIVDDATAKDPEERFYITATESTRKEMLEWLDKWGLQFPSKSVEKMREILKK